MVDFKGLLQGMSTVQKFAGAMLGVYAVMIIATIFLGILTGVGQGLSFVTRVYDPSTNASFNDTLGSIASSYNSLVTTLFDPVSLMIQLIIVVVLLIIFFKGGLPGTNSKDVM